MNSTKVLVPVRHPDGAYRVHQVLPSQLGWSDVRRLWGIAAVERPFCFAPPEEKLDLFFSYACQEAGLPLSIGTVFNPGWSELFANEIKHDCLVVSASVVQYVASGALFRSSIKALKLLVVVQGRQDHKLSQGEAFAPECRVEFLPHPVLELEG